MLYYLYMAKQKKKRNKAYTGTDAAVTRPTITRVSAVNRSKVGQWLYEHRQLRRPAIIALVVAAVIAFIIVAIVQLFVH